ncbi:hypothetical protein GCM10027088_64860 [Nocardia goodfellowii]
MTRRRKEELGSADATQGGTEVPSMLGPEGQLPKYGDQFYTRYRPMTPMELAANREERVAKQFGQGVLDRVFEAYRKSDELRRNVALNSAFSIDVETDVEWYY